MMNLKKKSINNGGVFSVLRQVINIISAAKYCNLNEITVPLWDKDFLVMPCLYCNDLYNLDEVVSILSDAIDISYTKASIYVEDTIDDIGKKDVCRYLDCYVINIKNINKIRYFGVNKVNGERLEDKLLKSIDELYFQMSTYIENSKENFNLQKLNFQNLTKKERNYSIYSFMFAYKILKSKYVDINIESFVSDEVATDSILFFKIKKIKTTFHCLLTTNCDKNKKIKNL